MRNSCLPFLLFCLFSLVGCGGGGASIAARPIESDQSVIVAQSDRGSGLHLSSVDTSVLINAGGAATSNWMGDSGYSGGWTATVGNSIDTHLVTNPAPQAVYQSQRTGSTLTYIVGNLKANASYSVRLHFVESWFSSGKQRLFNVAINNLAVLSNFDIYASAGGQNIAIAKTFSSIADSHGKITIQLNATLNNASVAGIEITGSSDAPDPTSTPTAEPANTSGWPSAGWTPYRGGPLTAPVGENPKYSSDSDTVINTLWNGRSSDAGFLQAYAGPPPPSNRDWTADVLYFGRSTDPEYTISCYNYGGACKASGAKVHIPRGAYPAGASDHHIDIRDTSTGKDIMLWEAPVPSGNGGQYSVGWGTIVDSDSNGLDAVGSTASGISALWSVRETDLMHNTVDHAIIVSINGESSRGFVYPANGWDNQFFKTNYPMMGSHFWLDVPPSQLPSSCPKYAVSYLTALHRFGAYMVDNASISHVFGIQVESDLSYTYNAGQSVWGPFMQSLGHNATGMNDLSIDNCGIDMQNHMHILTPPSAS